MNVKDHILSALKEQFNNGDDYYLQGVQLNAATPLIEEAKQIEKETPTLEEITEWVKGDLSYSLWS